MRSDWFIQGISKSCYDFNPRSYMRSDPNWYDNNRRYLQISIHAPTWEATYWSLVLRFILTISIHAPTWEATGNCYTRPRRHEISIHAPTWEATGCVLSTDKGLQISIHAPTWEATYRSWDRIKRNYNFNPRSYMRSDVYILIRLLSNHNFNPRSYMRSDAWKRI